MACSLVVHSIFTAGKMRTSSQDSRIPKDSHSYHYYHFSHLSRFTANDKL